MDVGEGEGEGRGVDHEVAGAGEGGDLPLLQLELREGDVELRLHRTPHPRGGATGGGEVGGSSREDGCTHVDGGTGVR